MQEILNTELLGNPLSRWLVALAALVGALLALVLLRSRVYAFLRNLAKRTRNRIDDLVITTLGETSRIFGITVAAYAGSRVLDLSPTTDRVLWHVIVAVVLAQGAMWAARLLREGIDMYGRSRFGEDGGTLTTIRALQSVSTLAVWVIAVLLVLENLGIHVSALVAGLGIGGIAIALAVQSVLADLFASLAILLDKPFVVGDMLVLGDMVGTVEEVGLKTTRLRSLSGEQLVMSNANLLDSRIRNYGRMEERRVAFSLGVTYQTSPSDLQAIPDTIRSIIESYPAARFDRSHFKTFGSSSLDIETVYYVTVPDYQAYMDLQQAINLDVYRRFAADGIEFAYPTQTVFVERSGPAD
ncbi:MAG: mechanosensitive ion channel family protein [Gemmatimonadota bacterium]